MILRTSSDLKLSVVNELIFRWYIISSRKMSVNGKINENDARTGGVRGTGPPVRSHG
jgi:hypothetical protein